LKSLDPRVARLPQIDVVSPLTPKPKLDQFGTYEVFVQAKEGKPFQHEGIVHASDLEMAFILAKESLTRRFTCVSLFATDTRDVSMSATTEGDGNAYDTIQEAASKGSKPQQFEVFHLPKRGKQHIHAGSVEATSTEEAFAEAKKKFGSLKAFNVWVIPTNKIRFTTQEEQDLWKTLPEKRFRDAADYKGGDKLKEFLERK
jgi:ring-1,2-phenylacetyl-CoA epoxidase subunit PaaB